LPTLQSFDETLSTGSHIIGITVYAIPGIPIRQRSDRIFIGAISQTRYYSENNDPAPAIDTTSKLLISDERHLGHLGFGPGGIVKRRRQGTRTARDGRIQHGRAATLDQIEAHIVLCHWMRVAERKDQSDVGTTRCSMR
jgi:hypothetical protein